MSQLLELPDPESSGAPVLQPDTTALAAERYALAVVLPLWMGAGSLDWFLHRRSRIESTSGSYESKLHALGIGLTAAPVLAGLLLEIDAGVLALMAAGYVTHFGMTVWDVAYADGRREIVPLEQHVHAALEILPFTALSLLTLAHRAQAGALLGRGSEPARFALRFKRRPIPARILFATLATFASAVALPYAEELLRCLRYERKRAILDAYAPREHGQIERSEEQRVPDEAERETYAR